MSGVKILKKEPRFVGTYSIQGLWNYNVWEYQGKLYENEGVSYLAKSPAVADAKKYHPDDAIVFGYGVLGFSERWTYAYPYKGRILKKWKYTPGKNKKVES